MLRGVAIVRTDVSEELSASFIRLATIGELGTTLTVTSNRRTLRRNLIRATRRNILEDIILQRDDIFTCDERLEKSCAHNSVAICKRGCQVVAPDWPVSGPRFATSGTT
jgi:hypothetical protein